VFRPFVPVSLAVEGASTPELEGLIDTGADAILASDLLADETTSPSSQAASLRRSLSRIATASMIASASSWPSSSPCAAV